MWEVQLAGEWKPMELDERFFLQELMRKKHALGNYENRGQQYLFNLPEMTQTNQKTGKVRRIRLNTLAKCVEAGGVISAAPVGGTSSEMMRAKTAQASLIKGPSSTSLNSEMSNSGISAFCEWASQEDVESIQQVFVSLKCVEVWLAGTWKRLGRRESAEIAMRQVKGDNKFQVVSRGMKYEINFENMTQTNMKTGRIRTIRVVDKEPHRHDGSFDGEFSFERFRKWFRTISMEESGPSSKHNVPIVTKQALVDNWPKMPPERSRLREETAKSVIDQVALRSEGKADMVEWIHHCALQRDQPSYTAGSEVTRKLVEALKQDHQVLGRMQMHYETALGEDQTSEGGSTTSGLSAQGLIRACKRLAEGPSQVIEKKWAQEVLEKDKRGECIEEDEEVTYFDFLNVMLGRKRFKVWLWMYDISQGAAERYSQYLLGHHFKGIWHTGVVIEWPQITSEFWFGGKVFESKPGTSPFGIPLEKRFVGYTYQLREETWKYAKETLAETFTQENYDVLLHNCNHFSNAMVSFLCNDTLPDEVLDQPRLVMSTWTARLLRPILNRWLGNFDGQDGRATSGESTDIQRRWMAVKPGCLITFVPDLRAKPQVGEVRIVKGEACIAWYINLEGEMLTSRVSPSMVSEVLVGPPLGFQCVAEDGDAMLLDSWEQEVSFEHYLACSKVCGWPLKGY